MKLCVFCGASTGKSPAYRLAAIELGHAMADAGIGLVYGGASVGLMGAVADAVLERGGEVIGVIPRFLADKELAHKKLTRLHVVGSMHQRKAMMASLADGFIALPGGLGTLEELFEIWTWGQLGHHQKPCALLDVGGFYTGLTDFLDHVATEGFVRPEFRNMLIVEPNAERLLPAMKGYQPLDDRRQHLSLHAPPRKTCFPEGFRGLSGISPRRAFPGNTALNIEFDNALSITAFDEKSLQMQRHGYIIASSIADRRSS